MRRERSHILGEGGLSAGTKTRSSLACPGPAHRRESLARQRRAAKVAAVLCGELGGHAKELGESDWLVDRFCHRWELRRSLQRRSSAVAAEETRRAEAVRQPSLFQCRERGPGLRQEVGQRPWAGLEQESRGKEDPAVLRGFILPRSEDRTRTLPGYSERAEVSSALNMVNLKNR